MYARKACISIHTPRDRRKERCLFIRFAKQPARPRGPVLLLSTQLPVFFVKRLFPSFRLDQPTNFLVSCGYAYQKLSISSPFIRQSSLFSPLLVLFPTKRGKTTSAFLPPSFLFVNYLYLASYLSRSICLALCVLSSSSSLCLGSPDEQAEEFR